MLAGKLASIADSAVTNAASNALSISYGLAPPSPAFLFPYPTSIVNDRAIYVALNFSAAMTEVCPGAACMVQLAPAGGRVDSVFDPDLGIALLRIEPGGAGALEVRVPAGAATSLVGGGSNAQAATLQLFYSGGLGWTTGLAVTASVLTGMALILTGELFQALHAMTSCL